MIFESAFLKDKTPDGLVIYRDELPFIFLSEEYKFRCMTIRDRSMYIYLTEEELEKNGANPETTKNKDFKDEIATNHDKMRALLKQMRKKM